MSFWEIKFLYDVFIRFIVMYMNNFCLSQSHPFPLPFPIHIFTNKANAMILAQSATLFFIILCPSSPPPQTSFPDDVNVTSVRK